MADRYVALLRGINVGRAKRVPMADLRELVSELGYSDVRTVLNSGNVVFAAGAAAPAGVSTRVTVLGGSQLDRIVEGNPLPQATADPSRSLVAFLADSADLDLLRPLDRRDWTPEALGLGEGVAYLWCPKGVSESTVVKAVGEILGDAVTSRNWATVLKLRSLVDDPG
jgi:uncharacterized protein (DUF1697 family)